jgi:uncharacterized protein (UPF0332 family)/predicted nucleotidyltransferase
MSLATTSLRRSERELLEAFAAALRARFGGALEGVWLYGSRARGERPRHADSDVDVLVMVDDAMEKTYSAVHEVLDEVARKLDLERTRFRFSVDAVSPGWLEGQRAIGSFFVAEVDRDKVDVDALSPASEKRPKPRVASVIAEPVRRHYLSMKPRSDQMMQRAVRRLTVARKAIDDDPSSAVSLAYYAMLYAARAALSERDDYGRTHDGTWFKFRQTFVERESSFDAQLASRAQRTKTRREDADYEGWFPPESDARETVALAERFLTQVEGMFATP